MKGPRNACLDMVLLALDGERPSGSISVGIFEWLLCVWLTYVDIN